MTATRCVFTGKVLRMDDIDRQIIARLIDDGRASYRALGDVVGLSTPAVKRRVDRMVADSVIEGFSVRVDPRAQGWSIEAIVELYCTDATAPRQIREVLQRLPEVVAAYTVTGSADALVHVLVADTPHLEETLERIRGEPFVAQTQSVIVLSRLIDRARPAG